MDVTSQIVKSSGFQTIFEIQAKKFRFQMVKLGQTILFLEIVSLYSERSITELVWYSEIKWCHKTKLFDSQTALDYSSTVSIQKNGKTYWQL
jgi:hypothetical protein